MKTTLPYTREVQVCPSCGEENPDRFRLCGFCGAELAPVHARQEARRTVSIVFCDLKGSTTLGERLDPEALREVLRRYFEEMRAVLERHGGRVEKYIGDAVMAVFGLPRIHEDDALRAVRAAAGMQDALAELNQELERRWGVALVNRIGVNTGELVVGDKLAGDHLVTGDAVNVAARLEQAAGECEVLIGESTFRLVKEAIDVEEVEPLELKGKAERVPAYRLLAVESEGEGATRRSDAPVVGREVELALLERELEHAVLDRNCRCVAVLGDAGVGKTHMTEALAASVAERAGVLRGRCLPYGEGITFWPIVELVRQAADVREHDTPELVRSKLAALLDSDDKVVDRVLSATGLSPEQFPVEELFWGIRKLLETLAGKRPLVVVFDDVHWAERVFLDLIGHLTDVVEAPLLLICPARHELLEVCPDFDARPRTRAVHLEPLSEAEASLVVENLLGGAALADDVLARILDATEGNPLFVEQMLSMMLDGALIRGESGFWVAADGAAAISIPPTIQALLAARLDNLSEAERGVLEPASVAGIVFPQPAVEALVPEALRGSVPAHLSAMTRKRFVHPDATAPPEDEHFRFNHILIRDAAYNGLLKRARATLHERFVEWADRVNAESGRETEYEEILGYHLEQAYRYLAELGPVDEHGQTVGGDGARRLASAGRRALARGDMRAATNLLGRAAALLVDSEEARIQILADLGEALLESGEVTAAEEVLQGAIASAERLGDRRAQAAAGLILLLVERRSTDAERWSERAPHELEQAITVFEEAGDHAGLAKAYRVLGWVHGTARRIGEAEDAARRGLEHAQLAGDVREERANATGFALAGLLGPTAVPAAIDRCTRILEQVSGSRRYEGFIACVLALLEGMRGNFGQARELSGRGRETLQELGEGGVLTAWPALYGSRVELLAGDAEAAEKALRNGYEILDRLGERYYLSSVAALLGEALYAQGRLAEAEELTATAEELAAEDDVAAQTLWRCVRGKVLTRRGKSAEGVVLIQEALAVLLPTDAELNKLEALLDLGEALRLGGEPFAWPFEEAARLAERKGNVVAAEKARRLLGLAVSAARG